MHHRIPSALVLVALLSLVACGAPADDGRTVLLRTDGCAQTRCAEYRSLCDASNSARIASCEGECIENASDAIGCGEACEAEAGCSVPCADPDACYAPSVAFRVTGEPDEALRAACQRATDAGTRCGAARVTGTCELIAHIELPANAALYDCLANVPCGGDLNTLCPQPAPGTIGDEYCAALAVTCTDGTACTPDTRDALNATEPWLRSQASAALRSCFAPAGPSCGAISACGNAWIRATYWPDA